MARAMQFAYGCNYCWYRVWVAYVICTCHDEHNVKRPLFLNHATETWSASIANVTKLSIHLTGKFNCRIATQSTSMNLNRNAGSSKMLAQSLGVRFEAWAGICAATVITCR
jgi:hypothetical protein